MEGYKTRISNCHPDIRLAGPREVDEHREPKVLRVACTLAPVSDNPGLFWIGWSRPFGDADFRQLRPHMLCWRAPDLDHNGTPELDEGRYIDAEGLEQAAARGYQILIDGRELPAPQGSFRAALAPHRASRFDPPLAPSSPSRLRDTTSLDLAPIYVRFLRPEGPIMGADLKEYGPFTAGQVAFIPHAHARVFIRNGAAKILE